MNLSQARAQLESAKSELAACIAPTRLAEAKMAQALAKIASVKGSGIAPTQIDSVIALAREVARTQEQNNARLFRLVQGIQEAIG